MIEFGLTSQLSSGTIQYIAPEVFCRGHIHGPESDFWSLGVVAFEMVYGARLFKEHCPIEFIRYIDAAYKKQQENLKDGFSKNAKTLSSGTGTTTIATGSMTNDSISSATDSLGSLAVRCGKDITTQLIPHWDFKVNGKDDSATQPNLSVTIPKESFMIGTVSIDCRSLLKKLLEVRPTKRLGSIFAAEEVFEQSLLIRYGVHHKNDMVNKLVSPFFVPGRKFLFSDDASYVHDPLSDPDPYLAARGINVGDDEILPESMNESFRAFSFISDKYSPYLSDTV